MARSLTEEQARIVAHEGDALVVRAYAGTGKSSTLQAFAARRPKARMLYVVFNKAMQREAAARFAGMRVVPATAHALAYRAFGERYRHKLRPGLKPHEVAAALGLDRGPAGRVAGLHLARRVIDSLGRFLASADSTPGERHAAPSARRFQGLAATEAALREALIEWTARLWARMCDPGDPAVGQLHDGYLKLYQLASPRLDRWDYLLADEAQDLNPVTLAILRPQPAWQVYVGDSHQQIYAFRGALDALDALVLEGAPALTLSGSFRFGEAIAGAANAILALKGADPPLRGLGGPGAVGPLPEGAPRAALLRTNAGVFARTVEAIARGEPWTHVGGSAGYRFDELTDVALLAQGRGGEARDPFVRTFDQYAALRDYAEETGDAELLSRCLVVERHGAKTLPWVEAIARKTGAAASPDEAAVAIGNVHKSKGLEWPAVELGDDFIDLADVPDPQRLPESQRALVLRALAEELNLLYVGATRARTALQPNADFRAFLAGRVPGGAPDAAGRRAAQAATSAESGGAAGRWTS